MTKIEGLHARRRNFVKIAVSPAGLADGRRRMGAGEAHSDGLLAPVTGPLATSARTWSMPGSSTGTRPSIRRRPQGRVRHRRHHLQSRSGADPGAPSRPPGERQPAGRSAVRARGAGGRPGEQGNRVPLVMDSAGADSVTKWDSGATVVRTAVSASQIGIRSATTVQGARRQERDLHRSGLHLGPGSRARMMRTYTEAGGKIDRVIWNPIGTRTTARPSPRSRRIPARSSRCCRPDRVRLFEGLVRLRHGQEKEDLLRLLDAPGRAAQPDDRAVGMIGNSLHYAAGLDTPENKAFTPSSPSATTGCRPGSASRPTPRACG